MIKFATRLALNVPKWIHDIKFENNELIIYIFPQFITPFFNYLKDHSNTQFKLLMDITAIDYPSNTNRFEVVYNLLNIQYNTRIRIKTHVDELTPIDSIVHIYSSAGWYEREVWDMFGIFFSNHPDRKSVV